MNDSDEEERQEEEKMEAAILQLSGELTAAYHEACKEVPDVVAKESNPRWFLRFHEGDPIAAARTMANYWKQRKEIFEDRAHKPIMDLSGNGGLTTDDVQLLQTGYCVNLPRDKNHRSVLYIDVSKRSPGRQTSPRVVFFALQSVMENETSRKDEFVMLINISNPFSANFHTPNLQLAKVLLEECMPIKDYRFHLIAAPHAPNLLDQRSFIDTTYTSARDRLGRFFDDSLITHVASSKDDCLSQLVEFDLSPEGLPVSFGGTWAGGCEPWRAVGQYDEDGDGGKVDLEIEPDLDCLFRNVLWCHNQRTTVAAAREMESSPAASRPTFAHMISQCSATAPSEQHPRKMARATADTVTAAATAASSDRAQYLLPSDPGPLLPRGGGGRSSMRSTTAAAEETKEQRDRRRQQEVIYGRRKRERERIEIQVLHQEHHRLRTNNEALQREGNRLEELLRRAEEEVERG